MASLIAGVTRAVSSTSVLLVRAVSNTSVLLVRAVSPPRSLHRPGPWSVAGLTRAVSNTSVLLARAVFWASLSSPSWVMVSRGRHASGSEHLCTTRPSGSTARCGRRASGFDQRWTTRPSGFAPPERGASAGPTFLITPVDRRHPLDNIRSTEAGRARETSENCECGTTAQAGDAASSVSFRRDGARREPEAVPVPPVRSDSWRSGATRAAGRLHEGGRHIGAPRRRSAALHTSPGTPCVNV